MQYGMSTVAVKVVKKLRIKNSDFEVEDRERN